MPVPIAVVESRVQTESELVETRLGKQGLEGRYAQVHAKRQLQSDWRLLDKEELFEGLYMGLEAGHIWADAWRVLKRQLSIYRRSLFLANQPMEPSVMSARAFLKRWLRQIGLEESEDLLLIDSGELSLNRLTASEEKKCYGECQTRLESEATASIEYDLVAKQALLIMDKKWVKVLIEVLTTCRGFSIAVLTGHVKESSESDVFLLFY